MRIYVSTSCLKNKDNVFYVLDKYQKTGFKNIELGSSHKYTKNLLQKLKRYPFNFILHNYFPPPKNQFIINLASQDRKILKRGIEQIKKSIDFCRELEIKLFTFHAGFCLDPEINLKFDKNKVPTSYEKAFQTFVNSVGEIDRYAIERDVKIAIENNVLSECNLINGSNKLLLMCEAWEFKNFFQEISSDNVGILLDLGHLKVTSNWLKFDKENFIKEVEDKVFLFHIHENDGKVDEHKSLNSASWCLDIINKKKFRNIPVVFEGLNLSIQEIIQNKKLLECYVNPH